MVAPTPTLPNDVVSNILTRLPVKSLCRFKTISKQCLKTISDSFFITSHLQFSIKNPNLLLLQYYPHNVDDFTEKKSTIHISARGIDGNSINNEFTLEINDTVEIVPSKWDFVCFVGENGFYVCNPSTCEFTKLPQSSHCTSGSGAVSAGLGFDAFKEEYVFIHLFDRSLQYDDYDIGCEILRFGNRNDGVYDSCDWKIVKDLCPCDVRGWGVLVNNVFYWMVFDEYVDPGDDEAIICFDLESEKFGIVLPPKGCVDLDAAWLLVELKGYLCLTDTATKPFCLEIWMMMRRDEWVKGFSIDFSGFGFDFEMVKSIVPLDYWNGEILLDVKQQSLQCFNVKSKRVRRMSNEIQGDWTWLHLYTDSFFSLGTR